MTSCSDVISGFDSFVKDNGDFLNIKNTLVVDTNKFDAHLSFFNNPKSDLGGQWDPSRKTLYYNLSGGVTYRVSAHEYGHALGLFHMENSSKNFMSYYDLSSVKSDLTYKLSSRQQYNLNQAYKSSWYEFWK